MYGTPHNDLLRAEKNCDLFGGGGNDTLIHMWSNSGKMEGGYGNDVIANYYRNENTNTSPWWDGRWVTISGGDGDDYIRNTQASVSVNGDAGNDTIENGAGTRTVQYTLPGNKNIADVKIYGGAGNDLIRHKDAGMEGAQVDDGPG